MPYELLSALDIRRALPHERLRIHLGPVIIMRVECRKIIWKDVSYGRSDLVRVEHKVCSRSSVQDRSLGGRGTLLPSGKQTTHLFGLRAAATDWFSSLDSQLFLGLRWVSEWWGTNSMLWESCLNTDVLVAAPRFECSRHQPKQNLPPVALLGRTLCFPSCIYRVVWFDSLSKGCLLMK